MNIEDIKVKVTDAEAKVEKIKALIEKYQKSKEKKIAALNKVFEQNNIGITYDDVKDNNSWIRDYREQPIFAELYSLCFDISIKNNSIKDTTKKLATAELNLQNWNEKLRVEKAKLQYIQDSIPQEIKDFLLDWKNDIKKYILEKRDEYTKDIKEFRANVNKIVYKFLTENEDATRYLVDIDLEEYNPRIDYIDIAHRDLYRVYKLHEYIDLEEKFDYKYQSPLFCQFKQKKFDEDWLEKELTEAMNRKLLDLMNRVTKITGVITSANLYVNNGDLNGTIIGEDGKARVETIGAGGYAIQRYHFRVLVKRVKD